MQNRRLLLGAALLAVACSGEKEEPARVPVSQPSAAADSADGVSARAATSAGGAVAPGAARRPPPTIALAAGDVARVTRGTIEEGIALTGDLRPIETIEVRARLEGDLVGVYAREGQRVRAGDVLARFESSEQESGYSSAEADRVAAESELATARWNLEQTTELHRAGAVSELDLKTSQQAVKTAQARLAAAQARLRASSSLVRDTRVLAPTTGVVARRLVESGEHVARGASLFTVVRSDVLELAAAVPARQANAVRVGQTVHFAADGRAFDGKVARLSPTIDPANRSVTVFVQIPNASGIIKGGTFATGRVISRVVPGALVVPTAAVRQSAENGQPFVYRIAGSLIDVAAVRLGIVDERGGQAEILSGLTEGDRVVVGNVGTLGRGMQVIVAGEENTGSPRGGAARP